MKNKKIEHAARLLREACIEQYMSKGSCQECDLFEEDAEYRCLAIHPNVWDALYPELKGK